MNKKMSLAMLLMVAISLSACSDKDVTVTSDTDFVEDVTNEQSNEISESMASPEPVKEESVEAEEPINDDETVNDDNEISEQNEVESTDETKLEEPVTRTECSEIVFTNTTSNIRLQPSSSAEKVETVNRGTELLRTAILDNGWSEIQFNGQVCYVSSKLIDTEKVTETAAETNTNESVPVDANANESAPVTTTAPTLAQSPGTKTFSNGETFVSRGTTPGGLNVWYISGDDGTWPDWLLSAYDETGITNDMSDYNKAVAINNYICRVVDYAPIGADDRALSVQCLLSGQAICTGYAHAFDVLCTMAGVYSQQVTGTAGGWAHEWNYVLIDGTKYWVDVTWNDTSNNACLMQTTQLADHTYGCDSN